MVGALHRFPVEDRSAGVSTRPMSAADVPAVARLHRRELHHGLYPKLGEPFLRRYHEVLRSSPHASCTVVGPVGNPVGFVVTLLDPRAHRAWVRRSRALRVLAFHGLVGLLAHPRALLLFLRTRVVRYARALLSDDGPATPAEQVPAVLLHVAVDPAARGQGIGAVLVGEVVADARDADRSAVRLVTAAGTPAERFYEHLGWTHAGTRPGRDGVLVTYFEHPLASPTP